MKNNRQLVDIAEARSFIEANWPHDPLLRRIGLNLLDMLPKVDPDNMTNADRIRTMTDDELAAALLTAGDSDGVFDFCRRDPECLAWLESGSIPDEKCLACAMAWLARPAGKAE